MALHEEGFLWDSFLGLAHDPLELFCDAKIAVYDHPQGGSAQWTPDGGVATKDVKPIYIGWASLTPNKDWRARNREWGGEATATHAYRIQILDLDENLAYEDYENDRLDPTKRVKFAEGMLVEVLEMRGDSRAEGLSLTVRNAVTDNNMWQQTLLCDMDTGKTGETVNDSGW